MMPPPWRPPTPTSPEAATRPGAAHARDVAVPRHPLRFEQVRIENTSHCGHHCFFCPREQLTRARGFMSVEDFGLVLERVGTHEGRVDLHGFGEPLLDAELPRKLTLLRRRWPRAVPTLYSTLGVHVPPERLHALVEAGLAHLELSFYGTDARSYALAHGVNRFDVARANLEALLRIRHELGSPLRVVVRAFPSHDQVPQPGTTPEAVQALHEWMRSIGVELVRERALHNYGGGRDYNPPDQKSACSIIWGLRYRILQVTWDLHVLPCCFDFNAEVRLGSLREQTLAEIFDSPMYRRFYQAHARNELGDYPICQACERCKEP